MPMIDISSSFIDHIFEMGQGIQDHLLISLFDLLIGILLIRFIVHTLRFVLKLTQMQVGLRYVLTSIIETVLWIFLTITLLNNLGFGNVLLPFAGSIAVIGILMAAGGSILLSDILAAIFLARDADFNVGDEVIVGWDPQTRGIIERMDARRIRLRDEDGLLHVIPNSVIERKEWIVVSRRSDISAMARATKVAKRLKTAALEKRTNLTSKKTHSRKNDQ